MDPVEAAVSPLEFCVEDPVDTDGGSPLAERDALDMFLVGKQHLLNLILRTRELDSFRSY